MSFALHEPKSYPAIMVSSTFTDLKEHRQKVIEAIQKFGYKANVMEHDGARADADVIESSLKMVQDSAGYFCVISHKYGQSPVNQERNPNRLSITELEFNEAMRLGRPILLFLMDDKHPVTKADIEVDPEKCKKLDAFRERAKRMHEDSEVERIYELFATLEQFSFAAVTAVGRLAQHFVSQDGGSAEDTTDAFAGDGALPHPPDLAALPRYLGSHSFIGRASELQTLTAWCGPADPNPILLFEAMGGSGKSMLTWEWLTKHATHARRDWAGRFWYSFYEKGAVMMDFCRQALAYMTARPADEFIKLRMLELSDRLMAELEQRPWLVVLDGLERVLVAYHRHDAAQLRDDEADTAIDQIGKRDPCAAIRPEDDELLRRLAAGTSSKILVSSRLTPRALINPSRMPLPGVRRETLPGLRPVDAEAMIRACGVTGSSQAIQAYLQTNCDCHPLVVGALAGLINDYPHDRGNFDQWANDPRYGGALNLADLDLAQRRNHILLAAIDALSLESRQLLQTLALLQGGADFETLKAFNPYSLPEPDEVVEPVEPTQHSSWLPWVKERDDRERARYEAALTRWQTYVKALDAWKNDPAVRAAPTKLGETVRDLEKRGLLQYDSSGRRYDLHPVVRGVAAGRMGGDETQKLGQKVVDHFTSQPHNPWETAETLEDVAPGLQVVRVLLRMKRYQEALTTYRGDLAKALFFNIEAHAETQALLKPFFPDGWDGEPVPLRTNYVAFLLQVAALSQVDASPKQAWKLLERTLAINIREANAVDLVGALRILARISRKANRHVEPTRILSLALDVAESMPSNEQIFVSSLDLFRLSIVFGAPNADQLWQKLDSLGRDWDRAIYRPGDAESARALDLFYRSKLTEEYLTKAEALSNSGRNRGAIQQLHALRGEWHMTCGAPVQAANSLAQATRMARERAGEDARSEALFALARLQAKQRFDARVEAERLSKTNDGGAALAVAELWRELGERDRAATHALYAHRWAVADGEPYVHRYHLDRTRALLVELGRELPQVSRYDPSKAGTHPWETNIRAFADGLREERAKRELKLKPRTAGTSPR